MFLPIDAHNGLAIYDQIVRQVKFAIAAGAVADGDLVPSVRESARELAVNPNTVARAYRKLQEDRVLEVVRGTGLAVTSGARKACQAERRRLIRARLREAITEAYRSGLERSQIEGLFGVELKSVQRRSR